MDLRSVKHVVVLARLLNFTKAAEELCITQSALSRSIQAIEKEANVKLFDRDRSGVHLTVVGRDFIKRATRLLLDAEDLERSLKRSANAEVGEVAIGMGPLSAQALLSGVLPELFADKPDLRSNIMVRNIDALLPALMKEDIELLITAEQARLSELPLQSEFLGWFPLSLIVRAGHPLTSGLKQRGQYDFPLLSPGYLGSVEHWPEYWQRFLSGPLHIIDDSGVAARILEETDAIWLSSTLAVKPDLQAGRLCEIKLPKAQRTFRLKLMMYRLNRRSLSPASMLLRDLFRKQLATAS